MAGEPANSRAALLLHQDFVWCLQDNPEFASQVGFHWRTPSGSAGSSASFAFAERLQDLSPSAFESRREHAAAVVAEADEILSMSPDSTHEKSLKLLRSACADEVEAIDLGCHFVPVNSIGYGGVLNNFVEALDWLPSSDSEAEESLRQSIADCHGDNFMLPADVSAREYAALSRVEKFPAQVEQYITLLQQGIARGIVATQTALRKVPSQISEAKTALETKTHAVNAELERLAKREDDTGRRCVLATEKFEAAVGALSVFFREYNDKAREGVGCSSLGSAENPNLGQTWYEICLRYHTTTSLSPEEVHQLGLAEVSKIEKRYVDDVLTPLGQADGSFGDFVDQLRADKAHSFEEPEQLLDGYRVMLAEIATKMPKYFNQSPRSQLEVVPITRETLPAAYYMQGLADGSRPGKFSVNVSNLASRPKYEMASLALHEGVPGHHHQGMLALENASVPAFTRFLEDRRYEFCPARRQLFAAYLEGWALYCEGLGEEMGMYEDPLRLFGRLSMEMMRAVRLVVDTGIHFKGWSVERAIEYMMEKTGMHREEVEAECYRYEAWPGQACAYKVGEIAIWRARRKAEASLGEKFDLRSFHDVVLGDGPLPLDYLRELVDNWIDDLAGQD